MNDSPAEGSSARSTSRSARGTLPLVHSIPNSTTASVVSLPGLTKTQTKLLLVNFRSGESVRQHPEIQSYLSDGWQIKSAVPRLVESEGTKLLVVLTKSDIPVRQEKFA